MRAYPKRDSLSIESKKMSDIYRIEDGIIYYNYYGKIFQREVCPEIVELLTRKRKVKILGKPKLMCFIYENELKSINSYILRWDQDFRLQPKYRKGYEKIRAIGDIEIKVNNKNIKDNWKRV